MVDANWSWTVAEAIRIGKAIAPYDVYWLEDPVASDDAEDLAAVKAALDIPIVAGQTKSLKQGFRPLLEKGAADFIMIALQCVGESRNGSKSQPWRRPGTFRSAATCFMISRSIWLRPFPMEAGWNICPGGMRSTKSLPAWSMGS